MFLTIKRCQPGIRSKIVLFASQKRVPRTDPEITSIHEAKWKDVYFSEYVNGEETFFYGGKDLSVDPANLVPRKWDEFSERSLAHAGDFTTMAQVAKKLNKRKEKGFYIDKFDIYIAVVLPANMTTRDLAVRLRMREELAEMLNKKRDQLKLVRKSPFIRPKRSTS